MKNTPSPTPYESLFKKPAARKKAGRIGVRGRKVEPVRKDKAGPVRDDRHNCPVTGKSDTWYSGNVLGEPFNETEKGTGEPSNSTVADDRGAVTDMVVGTEEMCWSEKARVVLKVYGDRMLSYRGDLEGIGVILAVLILMIASYLDGINTGKGMVRDRAVADGHAEYYIDAGAKQFRWKEHPFRLSDLEF